MKEIRSVILERIDGTWEIKLVLVTPGVIELKINWPFGVVGMFRGYTRKGFLKYKELKGEKL